MTKHLLDRPRAAATTTRAEKYLTAERREGLHPATRALIRRDRTAGEGRTGPYLRIAREGEGKV